MTCSIPLRRSLRGAARTGLSLFVGAFILTSAAGARAADITVTTTSDELDADGDCSLREAIHAANTDSAVSGCDAGSGTDAITLPEGTYNLTLLGAKENGNATGDLDVVGSISIHGAGASATVIDGNATDRAMHVLSGTVLIEDVAVQNGVAPQGAAGASCIAEVDCNESGQDGEDGGGIFTASGSSLTLRRVSIVDNEAGKGGTAGNVNCPIVGADCDTSPGYGGNGGGVAGQGALAIERSLVAQNRSGAAGSPGVVVACGGSCYSSSGNPGDGGGIIITGASLNLRASTIDANESFDWAGGVYCHHGSTCTVEDSTIVGNSAVYRGGGLTVIGVATTASVRNTTITGNQAGGPGGGVAAFSGTVDLDFVTIAGNSAGMSGGGIERVSANTVTLRSAIVADNTGPAGPDCSNTIVSGGYNHVENLTGCSMTLGTGDVTGSDPLLQVLADNDGGTQTHALTTISPAMDAIPIGDNGCGTTVTADQRGALRPADGDVSGTAACDKGAFELESPEPDYPFPTDVRKCQEAIAKLTGKYFGGRHKALAGCRSSLMKGTELFADQQELTPVRRGSQCANEFKTAGKIAKARQKVRDGLDKSCTDAILATLQACDATIDGLADATGSSGCLIQAVDSNVNDLIAVEYGY